MTAEGPRILLVEDDAHVAAGIVQGLRATSFRVELVTTGEAAVRTVLRQSPDLVVLDLMLPDVHGFEVLRQLQGKTATPIIVLTAQSELDERVEAFRLGAIDFVPKPFFLRELVARIQTRLHVAQSAPSRVVRWADAELDLDARKVSVAGKAVALTKHEHDLLACLVTRPGRAMSRAALAEAALDPLTDREARTIDSHVARLRKKLGRAGEAIVTVWGIGYRFDDAGGS
jgi:two-component system OmpR family response regulator